MTFLYPPCIVLHTNAFYKHVLQHIKNTCNYLHV
nr:MAG TPA: hypothetical protein [Caudoviricetes sp.]